MYIFNNIASANFNAPLSSVSPRLSPIVSLYVDSVKNNMNSSMTAIQEVVGEKIWKLNEVNYNAETANFASSVAAAMQQFMNNQTEAYIKENYDSMTTFTSQVLRNLFVGNLSVSQNSSAEESRVGAAGALIVSVFNRTSPTLTTNSTLKGMTNSLSVSFNTERIIKDFKDSLSHVVELYKNYESFERNVSNFEPSFLTWSTTLVAAFGLMALLGGGSIWQIQRTHAEAGTPDGDIAVAGIAVNDNANGRSGRGRTTPRDAAIVTWDQPMVLRNKKLVHKPGR